MKNKIILAGVLPMLLLASCSKNIDASSDANAPQNDTNVSVAGDTQSGALNPDIDKSQTPPDFGSGSEGRPDFGSGSGMPPGGFGSGERMGPPSGSGGKMMNGSGGTRPPRGEGRGGYGSGATKSDSTTKAS